MVQEPRWVAVLARKPQARLVVTAAGTIFHRRVGFIPDPGRSCGNRIEGRNQ